jgi:hypothetical protein
MKKLYEIYSGEELKIAELIQRRRLQLLINSYLYYYMDMNIVEDKTWDTWARDLLRLQNENPEISKEVDYYDAFKDWDASTGAFLPITLDWVVAKARTFMPKQKKASEPKKKKSGKKKLF